jgi:hypothetical protein
MPGPGSKACPKGPSRKTLKRKARALEVDIIDRVRAECVDRDGYCRIRQSGADALLGPCRSFSQWAHLEEHRRGKTRNQPPEERHQRKFSCMMCDGHHDLYDLHRFRITYLTDDAADGPLRYEKSSGETFDERMIRTSF